MALTVASLGTLVGILNASTLIIALPTMMVGLNTTLVNVMWVLIAYMLVMTILAPASGRLADMYGRKKIYIFGLVTFTIASLLCGIAADVYQLIGFRVFQAIGGAIIVANGTIIVADAFPKHELGRAMGILSMIMAGTFAIGPVIGGFLTLIDWRLNFFLNIPIGIFASYYAHKNLKEVQEFSGLESFDLKGMILFAVAFLSLTVYGSAGFMVGLFDPLMLTLLCIGLVTLGAFIRQEMTFPYPMIDLSLFKSRIFLFGQSSAFINAIARGAVMMLLILFFQGLQGYDPLIASILVVPMAIGIVVSGPIGGSLSDRYGSRLITTLGLGISLVGLVGLALMQYDTAYWIIAVWLFINGFGSGLFQPPNTSAIMTSVPLDRRGAASAMRAFFQNTGMVISMTIAMPLLINTVPLDEMMNMFIFGGVHQPVAIQVAFTHGITLAFWISSAITIFAIIVSAMRGTGDTMRGVQA
ncbi:MFS transporter [uncultured Methanospirillum sp.]|uniref:MFS transporter n=1 Tax=uncultured Methanospirillum sp. TaxID=262503 RepID=UPI0029C7BB07|nr:MFS transporter [uncultured Methanospirillum sp.]